MRRAIPTAFLFVAAACGRGSNDPAPASAPAETCAVTIPPGEIAPAPAPPFSVPRSRVVVEAELRLGNLQRELDKKVPPRVAEERNHDVGMAGHVNYTVDRGPFTTKVEGDRLLVETPLHARAEICASGRCYADCTPEARAVAAIPLRLTPEYRFAPSKVTIVVTRGCELRALGGMVRIDITGMLAPELRKRMGSVEREIDGKMPQLHPDRMWRELSMPRKLPLGGCFLLKPLAVTQGPVSGTAELLHVRFAIAAEPEISGRPCDGGAPPGPPPPLVWDPAIPKESDVHLALVSPMSQAAAALTTLPSIDLHGARVRIAAADARGARFVADLRGEACGLVGLDAGLRWSDDGRSVRLSSVKLAEPDRVRRASASVDWDALARAVEKDASIAPLATPEDLRSALPALASLVNDPDAAIGVTIDSAQGEAAGVRGDAMVAVVGLKGGLVVREK